jgi:hypothetical protein
MSDIIEASSPLARREVAGDQVEISVRVFAQCNRRGLERLRLEVGVRGQFKQIPRIVGIAGAMGEAPKADGASAQVMDRGHERYWHTTGSDQLI